MPSPGGGGGVCGRGRCPSCAVPVGPLSEHLSPTLSFLHTPLLEYFPRVGANPLGARRCAGPRRFVFPRPNCHTPFLRVRGGLGVTELLASSGAAPGTTRGAGPWPAHRASHRAGSSLRGSRQLDRSGLGLSCGRPRCGLPCPGHGEAGQENQERYRGAGEGKALGPSLPHVPSVEWGRRLFTGPAFGVQP